MSKKRITAPDEHSTHVVAGRNPLRELLRHTPERLIEILTVKFDGAPPHEAAQLLTLIKQSGLPLKYCSEAELDALAGSAAHQRFVALVTPKPTLDIKGLLELVRGEEPRLIVALDQIEDPHNVGAIIRAAECFGADAVVWSKNRGAQLTPAAIKASAGASELIEIATVSNLAEALRRLKDEQLWLVGAENRENAEELARFEFPPRCVLVLGSEGSGLHSLIQKELDFAVRIPLKGKIDSLNVSQAGAVLMHGYCAALNRSSSAR